MSTFKEANQVRLILKMKLSSYYWYTSSRVIADSDGFAVVITVKILDNKVRKIVAPVTQGISVKLES
jgi:hypothetical protein